MAVAASQVLEVAAVGRPHQPLVVLDGGREPLSGHLSPDPVPHLVVGAVGINQDSGQLGQQDDLVVGGLRHLTAILVEFAAGPGHAVSQEPVEAVDHHLVDAGNEPSTRWSIGFLATCRQR
ncbi:MAG TPA: hypothetical protein VFH30_11640 [Acidimicrobiales bacterium]|nr:hypothetical protein [Acidimicrobiales bacterium]